MNMEDPIITICFPEIGKVRICFYGISGELFKLYEKVNEINRQKGIKHLGLLSNVFDSAIHTRHEYVMLQCAFADITNVLNKGSISAQGQLKIDGETFPGNSIIKAWFLLSNFGHCQNVLADEKALLYHCHRKRNFKSHILNTIKDDEASEWARNVIEEFKYMDFHHVLSMYRIYKSLPRLVRQQKRIINLYKLLLLENKDHATIDTLKLSSLRRIFKTIRRLSVLCIDGHYTHLPIKVDIMSAISNLNTDESILKEKKKKKTLDPFYSMMCDDIYLNEDVLRIQRHYEVAILELIEDSNPQDILHNSFHGEYDLPSQPTYHNFMRFRIPHDINSQGGYFNTFAKVQKSISNCHHSEVSLDWNPITREDYIDYYLKEQGNDIAILELSYATCVYIFDIARQHFRNRRKKNSKLLKTVRDFKEISGKDAKELLESINDAISGEMWNELYPQMISSYREFLYRIINMFTKDHIRIDVRGRSEKYDDLGFKYIKNDFGAKETINKAISNTTQKERIKELNHLKHSISRTFDGFTIAYLPGMTLFDDTKPPGKNLVTEIDSIVLKISHDKFHLDFNETKDMKKGIEKAAKKDLKTKLVRVLREGVRYQIRETRGYGARLRVTISK